MVRPDYSTSFTVKNISDGILHYRVVLTNPDNYVLLGKATGTLSQDETLSMRLQLKLYDSISTFNYDSNSVCLLIRTEGTEEKDALSVDIVVDPTGIISLPKALDNYMRRHVKIQSCQETLNEEEEAYLLSRFISLG